MKLLADVTPPAIYHGCSIQKNFEEEKFTLVNMTSCGRHNVRKHREINNGDQYITLGFSLNLNCLYKREAVSWGSRDYMERSGKGLTISLAIRNKSPNKKKMQGLPILKLLTNISGIYSGSLIIIQIVSKQTTSKLSYLKKSHLYNLIPTPLLSTPFGEYNSQQ